MRYLEVFSAFVTAHPIMFVVVGLSTAAICGMIYQAKVDVAYWESHDDWNDEE